MDYISFCGDSLERLKKLPDGCVDLIYIDRRSTRTATMRFWGETKESGRLTTATSRRRLRQGDRKRSS